MLVYLTLGHAECATQKYDCALISYKNCLDMAVSTHDVNHQTKSLVNMASLHVSLGNCLPLFILKLKVKMTLLKNPMNNLTYGSKEVLLNYSTNHDSYVSHTVSQSKVRIL